MTFALYNVVDIAGTINAGGAAVTTTITSPAKCEVHVRRNFGSASELENDWCDTHMQRCDDLQTGWFDEGSELLSFFKKR